MTTTSKKKARGRKPSARKPVLSMDLIDSNPDQAVKVTDAFVDKSNPLRRVKITCCVGYRRDAVAKVNEWIWCDTHGDLARVIEVDE